MIFSAKKVTDSPVVHSSKSSDYWQPSLSPTDIIVLLLVYNNDKINIPSQSFPGQPHVAPVLQYARTERVRRRDKRRRRTSCTSQRARNLVRRIVSHSSDSSWHISCMLGTTTKVSVLFQVLGSQLHLTEIFFLCLRPLFSFSSHAACLFGIRFAGLIVDLGLCTH